MGRAQQATSDRGPLIAIIGPCKEIVLASKRTNGVNGRAVENTLRRVIPAGNWGEARNAALDGAGFLSPFGPG